MILIGMMGCGKTTVGGLLAHALDYEQADTDALIEAREGRTLSALFAAEGESYFRDCEVEISTELAQRSGLIVSCGGGLPLRADAIRALKKSGVVFWLDRDPGETYDGLDTAARPLAQEGRTAFLARYEQRAPIYRAWADHIIRARSAAEAADAIITILQNREQAE